jgi:hypothetical protein
VFGEQVDHPPGKIANIVGKLFVLAADVFEREPEAARHADLRPGDRVVVVHFDVVDRLVAFVEAEPAEIDIDALARDQFFHGVELDGDFFLAFADFDDDRGVLDAEVVARGELDRERLVAVHLQILVRLENLDGGKTVGADAEIIGDRLVAKAERVLDLELIAAGLKQDEIALELIAVDLERHLAALVEHELRLHDFLAGVGFEAHRRSAESFEVATGNIFGRQAGVIRRVKRGPHVADLRRIDRFEPVARRRERARDGAIGKTVLHVVQRRGEAAGAGRFHREPFLGGAFARHEQLHRFRQRAGGDRLQRHGSAARDAEPLGRKIDARLRRRDSFQRMREQAERIADRGRVEEHRGEHRDEEDREQPPLGDRRGGAHQLFGLQRVELLARRAQEREHH